ncbi:LysR family transcriptional regulator [Klenkia sp. PcliD-1-E]|uniref:LysR family transcriptional regulator n=1 Tax=Klenkia sp. PcliD-1-E TaxID=2954492 RepID=UPI002097E9E7|nr:LysR family transcriptional regulator [Klenkia sp. PcliD-1-E]MCO7219843.1 LysR family transcriptional regulator [Klenkia sp. PcliD-1-E]
MKDVTLRQLEYFIAVAEAESITRAALACHVTQAAISLALKDLEQTMGVQLAIRRRSKGVHLTPAGRELATRARTLVHDAHHLLRSAESDDGFRGTLTVGCFSTLSTTVLPPLAGFLAEEHPGVDLEIVEGSGPAVQERMLRGQVDLCFVYEAQVLDEVEAVPLQERRFHVVLSPEHPLADRDDVDLADLAGHPAALLDIEPATYLNRAMLRAAGIDPLVAYRSADVHTIRALVGRNLAWSLLMEPCDASSEGRPLRFLPLRGGLGVNSVMLAYPRGVRLPRLSQEVATFSQRAFGGAS